MERALMALSHQSDERRTVEQLIDVKFALRSALQLVGELDAALKQGREGLMAAEEIGDHGRIALGCAWIANTLCVMGQGVEARQLAYQGLRAAEAANDRGAFVGANTLVGAAHWILGDYAESRTHLEKALAMIHDHFSDASALPLPIWQMTSNSRAWLVLLLVEIGEFDQALGIARAVSREVETRGATHPLVIFAQDWALLMRGDYPAALPGLEHGRLVCESTNHQVMLVPLIAALGRAYALAGRLADATQTLKRAIASAETYNRANRSLWLSFLSEAYLSSGRFEDAAEAARRGLDGARARQERGEEAWTLRAMAEAEAAIHGPTSAEAVAYYQDALARAMQLGMRPLTAHCHRGLARLERSAGRMREAQQHFAAATALYRDMGMTYWLDNLEEGDAP
jgi:tetratricopeptide (TPR) repeat protein